MGQRSASSVALSMCVTCSWHSCLRVASQSVAAHAESLLRWCPMPRAKDATKLFWTAQTAMCHFIRNVASPGKRSRWSVTCLVLHCEQFAGHILQSGTRCHHDKQVAMRMWPCRLCI